jgi:hypothetical protein
MMKQASEYTKLRNELLNEARGLLANQPDTLELTDSQLEQHLLHDTPAVVPLELRLRLRDLEVAEAFRALRIERST